MDRLLLSFPSCSLLPETWSMLQEQLGCSPASLQLFAPTLNKPAYIVVTNKDSSLCLLLPLEVLHMSTGTPST